MTTPYIQAYWYATLKGIPLSEFVRLGSDDLSEVIYTDHYGNALTGLRAHSVPRSAAIAVRDHRAPYARVFAEAPTEGAFWYENSIGLVELAVKGASAARLLGIGPGDPVRLVD